ncbi:MAG: hypothetical protein JRE58_09315 [Deltaproteobacteria bacterium]|nr:hypothetical protein [Deltaproteobacteria bacterium]
MVIGHLLMGYSLPVMSLFRVALYLVPEGLIKPFGSRKPILEKTRRLATPCLKGQRHNSVDSLQPPMIFS